MAIEDAVQMPVQAVVSLVQQNADGGVVLGDGDEEENGKQIAVENDAILADLPVEVDIIMIIICYLS